MKEKLFLQVKPSHMIFATLPLKAVKAINESDHTLFWPDILPGKLNLHA